MPIKGIILDVSDTLVHNGTLVPGVGQLWAYCRMRGIRTIVASNRPAEINRLRQLGFTADFDATPGTIGKPKGSPDWVTKPAAALGLTPRDLIYVGDHDFNDAVTASHARIPYIRAAWANPTGKYGIPMPRLGVVTSYLDMFFLKEHPWFWLADGQDSAGRPFIYRAMVDCRTGDAAQRRVKEAANSALKDGAVARRHFFMHHLLASLFLSGLSDTLDFWTTYPSHNANSIGHPVLEGFLTDASLLFRDKYRPLLRRHTESRSSRQQRNHGGIPQLTEQIQTVSLIEQARKDIEGHHILVVDDFTTSTNSLAWSRALLLQGGARAITSVAVGKYGTDCKTITVRSSIQGFNPFVPLTLTENDFEVRSPLPSSRDDQANVELQISLDTFDKRSPLA